MTSKNKPVGTLDFTPLLHRPTRQDYREFSDIYGSIPIMDILQRFVAIVPVLIILMSIGLIIGYTINAGDAWSFGVIAVTIVTIPVLFLGRLSTRDSEVRLYNFARRSGATLLLKSRTMDGYVGMVFDNGYGRLIKQSLIFPNGVEIGNFRYELGEGKAHRYVVTGYARMKVKKALPNIVLDSKKNNSFFGSNLLDAFSKSQRLKLEGDFNEFFDLYVPDDYKRDALYLLTPDVMQSLKTHGAEFDIEIVDNYVLLYGVRSFDLTRPEIISMILRSIGAICDELAGQSARYNDERGARIAAHDIAPQGRRLRQSVGWVGAGLFTFGIALVYVYWSQIENILESSHVGLWAGMIIIVMSLIQLIVVVLRR